MRVHVCVFVGECECVWVSGCGCTCMCEISALHVHVYGLFEAKVNGLGIVSDVIEGVISRDEVELSI